MEAAPAADRRGTVLLSEVSCLAYRSLYVVADTHVAMERPATPRHGRPGAMPSVIETRDAGMDLVRRVNRWLVAGAVSAAGFLSLIASHAFHGHRVAAGDPTSSASRGVQVPQAPSSSGGGLASPAQAPTPATPGPGAVVSGGS